MDLKKKNRKEPFMTRDRVKQQNVTFDIKKRNTKSMGLLFC